MHSEPVCVSLVSAPSRSEELVEHLLKAVEMALFHIATRLDPISEYHRPQTRCLSRTGHLRLAALAAEQVTQDLTQDVIISGLMRSGSGQAAPQAPQRAPEQGGGLIDILRQIFGQGIPGATEPTSNEPPAPSKSPTGGGGLGRELGPGSGYQIPESRGQPIPTDSGGESTPGGDVLGQVLRELEKAIREGRLKPVVIGPYEIDIPKQAGPADSAQPQIAGGDSNDDRQKLLQNG